MWMKLHSQLKNNLQIRRFWRFPTAKWCNPSWRSRSTWGSRSSRWRPGRDRTNWQLPCDPAFPARFSLSATLTHRAHCEIFCAAAASRGPPERAPDVCVNALLSRGAKDRAPDTLQTAAHPVGRQQQKSVQWDTDLILGSQRSTHCQRDEIVNAHASTPRRRMPWVLLSKKTRLRSTIFMRSFSSFIQCKTKCIKYILDAEQ